MNAEERHELRENDLASWLQYGLWNFLRQNGSYILLVFALAFLGYQLWNMHVRKEEVARLNAWNDLRLAQEGEDSISKLRLLVDSSPINAVKAQASLELGTRYDQLVAFPEDLDKQKLSAEESLSKAFDAFKSALDLQGDDPLVAAKAHLGMAAVLEDKADWDKAKAEYQLLADKSGKFANTPFAALAEDRLATLNDRKDAPQLAADYRRLLKIRRETPLPSTPTGTALPGNFPLPSGIGVPSGGLMGPTNQSQFPGLMNSPLPPLIGPPPPASPLSPAVPFGGVNPATPGPTLTPPPAPEPATAPK